MANVLGTMMHSFAAMAPITKIRSDIACNEASVDPAIRAILRAAKHGEGAIGDGKIFVRPLEQCIRIRTEERGGNAIWEGLSQKVHSAIWEAGGDRLRGKLTINS